MSEANTADAHEVLFEQDDHVATIVLNRPAKLNAVTPAMAARLIELVDRCNTDPDVRVVILTGAGERRFAPAAISASLTITHRRGISAIGPTIATPYGD